MPAQKCAFATSADYFVSKGQQLGRLGALTRLSPAELQESRACDLLRERAQF